MPRRSTLIGSAVVGLVLLLFISAVAIAQPPDPHKMAALTSSDAVAAVSGFASTSGFASPSELTASGPFNGKNQLYFSVEGAGLSANVDAFDGTIRTLSLVDAFPTSARVVIDATKARQLADDFIDSHHVARSNAEPKVSLIDHGTFQEYLVEWQSRVNGALVPDYESVSLNPETGAVFGYTNFARAYTPPPSALIDRITAEDIARKQLDAAHIWRTQSAELMVDFGDTGSQRLLWLIMLDDGGMSVAGVEVDAMTGAAQIVARG